MCCQPYLGHKYVATSLTLVLLLVWQRLCDDLEDPTTDKEREAEEHDEETEEDAKEDHDGSKCH